MRSAIFSILPVAVSAALLAGCAVGPDYEPPKIVAPQAFMGGGAIEARSAAPAMSASNDAWWRGFNDPVLDRLVDRALAQNLDLAQAAARVTQ
ncbi:MAG TPA: TolC family protein, partial [Caulobacter sp.]|nr:TolC family protein [Caulobacter sp.]